MAESTVRQWSRHDVQAWLLSLNIPCGAPLLQTVDGRFLYQLHSLRAEANALKSLLAHDSVLPAPSRHDTVDTDQKTSSPKVDKPVQTIKEAKMTAALTEVNLASEPESAVPTATEEAGTGKASVQDIPGDKESISLEQGVPPSLQDEGARAESPALTAALQGLPPVAAGATAAPVPEVSSVEFAAILKRELAVALERTSRGSPSPPPPTRQQSSHLKDESEDKTDTNLKGKDGKN
ncbi:Hypp1421 [Branchiostoma lanceolatum]|uniref:Hypp1421 protein n=1 Tax=Branchiostoma lanceolatum TaxID=7740 RepID=A0A8K0EKT4_BRALA|nr:Hypp1421 [Branchiostoma lanceolatum]